MPLLRDVLRAWQSTLPPDVAATWRRGAVYLRESTLQSGVGNSPEMQLRNTLLLLAAKHVWVPETGIFFDVASGASLNGRVAFQRLFEESIAGGFEVIGVFGPDRLFRNQEDAIKIRRAFREQNIELEYLGKFEGDPKDAASYQLNAIVDMQSHVHAHMASQNVGRHFEALSRAGRPVTGNPEVYEPIEWAPSFLGRPGSIIAWKLAEPLASIIREGCKRFLDGATLTQVAAWSATTTLGGTTPAGHPTDIKWWRQTLVNPKYGGFQHPTVWPGFKPTTEERRKAEAEARSQLVVCVLPALWDRDTYDRILATLDARWHGPKVRAAYRSYLLSGIAYDEECGHVIAVSKSGRSDGHYWMTCLERTVRGRGSRHLRADIAERELDEIIAGLRFDDTDLIEQIELELSRRIEAASEAVETFSPNPEIAALRQAVAALERVKSDVAGIRAELEARLEQLQALDEAHREILSRPVVEFRTAMSHLTEWGSVWREADSKTKNQLLREAEVEVWLGKLPGEARKPAHVRRITSANPVFNLALAAGLATFSSRYANDRPLWLGNLEIEITFGENSPISPEALSLTRGEGMVVSLPRERSSQDARYPDDGLWWTTGQVAKALGRSKKFVQCAISRGTLAVTWMQRGGSPYRLVSDAELSRFLAVPRPAPVPRDKASAALMLWLTAALHTCPLPRQEVARRAEVSHGTVKIIASGTRTTRRDLAIRVARAVLAAGPSAVGQRLLAAEVAGSSAGEAEVLELAA